MICSVRDQSVCTLLHDRLGGVTNARVIMGCCPDIVGSHYFDEVVPRGLQHIVQVDATSEFAKPCLVPATVPCSFHQVAWLDNRRSVGQWGLFLATASLEAVIQMDSVYTESKWCIRKIASTEILWAWDYNQHQVDHCASFFVNGIQGRIVCV